ncbi:unnamed protein product [Allacma fusca]|uniref:O-acyltransferase WSD1-like N-terminal domain-containing protein n=1 Tax=Allacma fusca TaxID=39272 RepID=A0A8J2K895_9HEXA|nr:unnamed protein product [Allacma fusca]
MSLTAKILDELTTVAIAIPILFSSLGFYFTFIMTFLVRVVVQLLARIFRPDLKNILTALHATFAMGHSKDKALESVVITMILEGKLSLQEMREGAQKRIFDFAKDKNYKFPLLHHTWTFFCGYAFWIEEDDFDIKNHIRDYDYEGELCIPSPCSEKEMRSVLAELFQMPYNRSRSPWEFLRVSNVNYNGKECTGIFLRMDHALGDGYSILEFLRTISGSNFSVPKFKMSEKKSTVLEKLGFLFKVPFDIAVNIKPALRTRGLPQLRPSLIGEEIVCISSVVNVETVNKIKNHFQVSYAAVLYAVVCGAIERAMTRSNQNVPDGLLGGVVVPVPNHPGGMCNHVTTAAAKWPIRRTSQSKRLLEIQQDLITLFRSTTIMAYFRANCRAGFAPTNLGRLVPLGGGLIGRLFGFGVVITNFPTTRGPDYFDGHEYLDCTVGLPTVLPCGIFVSIWGLNNQQRFNFNVRRNLFASDEICRNLGKYAMEELQELLEATN